ncbi:hypothetical protein D1007_19667 [Hordeum vulgare]|nr:hypothetical protein D1007_19667 [Hordeum vulgare]
MAQGTRRTPSCLYPNSCAAISSSAASDGCRSVSTRTTNRWHSSSLSPSPTTSTGTHPRGTLLPPSLTRSEKLSRRISSLIVGGSRTKVGDISYSSIVYIANC